MMFSLSCLSSGGGGDDDARTLGDRRGAIYDRLIKLNDAHFSVGTANFYMGHKCMMQFAYPMYHNLQSKGLPGMLGCS